MTLQTIEQMEMLAGEGKGCTITQASIATGAGTAPIAATGNLGAIWFPESIGTTLWSVLVKPRIPSGSFRHYSTQVGSTRGLTYMLARLHLMGSVALTSTGDQFTPSAATFPVLRTEMGQASQPMILTPLIQVTTATTVTAPILTIDYDNQDGNPVTGTLQTTFPSATTALGSMYLPRLETGDSGVEKINAVNIATAASSGAAVVYGLEPLDLCSVFAANVACAASYLRGYNPPPLEAPTPTSGTLDSYIGVVAMGSVAATTIRAVIRGVSNA